MVGVAAVSVLADGSAAHRQEQAWRAPDEQAEVQICNSRQAVEHGGVGELDDDLARRHRLRRPIVRRRSAGPGYAAFPGPGRLPLAQVAGDRPPARQAGRHRRLHRPAPAGEGGEIAPREQAVDGPHDTPVIEGLLVPVGLVVRKIVVPRQVGQGSPGLARRHPPVEGAKLEETAAVGVSDLDRPAVGLGHVNGELGHAFQALEVPGREGRPRRLRAGRVPGPGQGVHFHRGGGQCRVVAPGPAVVFGQGRPLVPGQAEDQGRGIDRHLGG